MWFAADSSKRIYLNVIALCNSQCCAIVLIFLQFFAQLMNHLRAYLNRNRVTLFYERMVSFGGGGAKIKEKKNKI